MTKPRRHDNGVKTKRAEDYLKARYARILLPEHDGGYVAEILEFPGCVAEGGTAEEALRNLERAAASWIEAALEQGQQIPQPMDTSAFSGRIALRLPRSLHRRAAQVAQRDGTSLNQLVVTAVAAQLGADDVIGRLAETWTSARLNVVHIQSIVQNAQIAVNVSPMIWSLSGSSGSLAPFEHHGTAVTTSTLPALNAVAGGSRSGR